MRKIYEKIYRKTHLRIISMILSLVYIGIINVKYVVGGMHGEKDIIISKDKAIENIARVYDIPNTKRIPVVASKEETSSEINLSIIIPAYNVQKYISACIDSILKQETQYSYEIIVINDGSTDDTSKELEKYATNKNVHIINQENKGIGAARNRGIDEAFGKYIMFVDSDDKLAPDAIDNLFISSDGFTIDIVQGGYRRFTDDGKYSQLFVQKSQSGMKDKLIFQQYLGFPWGKIYKRELWNNIRFPEKIWYEDSIIRNLIYPLAQNIAICDKAVYEYRANDNSISNLSKKRVKAVDTYFVIENILYMAKWYGIERITEDYYMEWFFKTQITGLLWNRMNGLDEILLKSVFTLICDLVDSYQIVYSGNDRLTKEIYKAIVERKYSRWSNCAKYLSYQV